MLFFLVATVDSNNYVIRLFLDPGFAIQKLQEAKDASLAKELDKDINSSGKKNVPPAFLSQKKLQEATDASLAKAFDEETNFCDEETNLCDEETNFCDEINEPRAVLLSSIDKQDACPFRWSHEAILLLIEEYIIRENAFKSGQISQKRVWEMDCNELVKKRHAVTAPQCMSKYNGSKKTYKSVKDHNGKSGNGTRAWPYFDIMDALSKSEPFMASSTGKRSRAESETSSDSHTGDTTPKRCAQVSNKDIIAVIQKSKELAEENRERRHHEKMAQRDKSLMLLEKIVSALDK